MRRLVDPILRILPSWQSQLWNFASTYSDAHHVEVTVERTL